MNMTFKAEKFKEWTLTDNEIIIGRKKIPLTSLTQVKQYAPWKEGHFNAVITIKYGSGLFDEKNLVYPKIQKDEGDKAAKYLLSFVGKNNKHIDAKKKNLLMSKLIQKSQIYYL